MMKRLAILLFLAIPACAVSAFAQSPRVYKRTIPKSGKVTIPFTPHFDQRPACRITKGKGAVYATSHEWVEVHGKPGVLLEVTCE